jgi:hypothetical protein
VTWEIEAEEAKAAEEAQATEMQALLAEADKAIDKATPKPEPYLDDAGRLRSSDGRVLDADGAAAALRTLATGDHDAANELLERLEASDPTMASRIVDHLAGDQEEH